MRPVLALPVAALVVVLAGCGGAGRATSARPTTPGSSSMPTAPDLAMPAPPARPRPPQPVDPRTAAADATLRQRMSGLLALCGVRGFTECARLGAHYLDASGTPATVSVADLLTQLPTLRAQVSGYLARAGGGAYDSGWQGFASPAGTDWAYALGRFAVRLVVVSDGGRLRYRTFVADVYDFDPGRPFAELRALADHGRAAEFLTTGASRTVSADAGAPLSW